MPNPETKPAFQPLFIGQRNDEEVVFILWRHWYTVVAPILKAVLIIGLSFASPLWLNATGLIFSYAITATIYYLWIVFWIGYAVSQYLNWYQDRFIVTNQRIIDIDQRGLTRRRVAEVELDRIQHVAHAVVGVFPTMLNFGTIIIQAAGGHELELRQVSEPAGVQEEITQLVKLATADTPVTAEELIDFIKERRI